MTLSYSLLAEYRDTIVDSVLDFRIAISSAKVIVAKFTNRFDAAFDALLNKVPENLERTEWTAAASGFTLQGTSNDNITGEIVSAVGDVLSVRFSFIDRSKVQGEYVDFGFTLANETEGLYDTLVPVRLEAVTCADHADILLAAKDELRGTAKLNWDRDLDLHYWDGVRSIDGGCVTRLGLEQRQLTGSIPASLGNLSSLKVLDLDQNQLTGSIPASLGNHYSSLIYNRLSGCIPEGVFFSHVNPQGPYGFVSQQYDLQYCDEESRSGHFGNRRPGDRRNTNGTPATPQATG